MRINITHGKEPTSNDSIKIAPIALPPPIARFQTVTNIDWAISVPFLALSAIAVCVSVAAPPKVKPHKVTAI